MIERKVFLPHKEGLGYEIPLGPLRLVFISTDTGLVGCGAFDVMALDRFGYPAARAKPVMSGVIATLDDLMEGEIRDANQNASARGIRKGMPVREALSYL
jgi:uncharacterized protein YunC (DUF1805 family)